MDDGIPSNIKKDLILVGVEGNRFDILKSTIFKSSMLIQEVIVAQFCVIFNFINLSSCVI